MTYFTIRTTYTENLFKPSPGVLTYTHNQYAKVILSTFICAEVVYVRSRLLMSNHDHDAYIDDDDELARLVAFRRRRCMRSHYPIGQLP